MREDSAFSDALLAAGTLALFFVVLGYSLYRVVVWARQRRKRAYIAGAVLAPLFALGNVSDPDFRIVQEAKRLKNREDDNPGDPPDSETEAIAVAASMAAKRRALPRTQNRPSKEEGVMSQVAVSRPALVWIISIGGGAAAVLALLALSWLALADIATLSWQARAVRESLSTFEWGSLYGLEALLLLSMIMLFRLRRSALGLFAAYLALGALATAAYALLPEQRGYFDLRVTLVVGLPAAIAVLAYMFRLKKRAVLA